MNCQQSLTLFAGGIPANRSVSPGNKEAKKMTVISGLKCSVLYRKPGQLGSLVKMLLGTSIWGSTKCYLTWKARATKHNRLLFQLVPSTPNIEEIESGLWATPNTMDHLPTRSMESLKKMATTSRKGRSNPANLREQVHPKVVMKWKFWATPVARECRLGYQKRNNNKKGSQKNLTTEIIDSMGGREIVSGQLNPAWVEWLMGYPAGWTELSRSGIL